MLSETEIRTGNRNIDQKKKTEQIAQLTQLFVLSQFSISVCSIFFFSFFFSFLRLFSLLTFEHSNSLELLLTFHYQSPSIEEKKNTHKKKTIKTTKTMSRHKKWLRVCMCINMQSWLFNTRTILSPDNQKIDWIFSSQPKKKIIYGRKKQKSSQQINCKEMC